MPSVSTCLPQDSHANAMKVTPATAQAARRWVINSPITNHIALKYSMAECFYHEGAVLALGPRCPDESLVCSEFATCLFTTKFECKCTDGYTGDGLTCTGDIEFIG